MSSIVLTGADHAALVLRGFDKRVRRAALMSINSTARRYRTEGAREIRKQVNLTATYVNKHLAVEKATEKTLEARITATRRPVLLSRYGAQQVTRKAKRKGAKGDPSRGIAAGRKAAGVSVKVKAGGARKKMRSAFLIRLRHGKYANEGSVGLAVRTGKGRDAYEIKHGPSVDQVWRGVRRDLKPKAADYLSTEFRRQLARIRK